MKIVELHFQDSLLLVIKKIDTIPGKSLNLPPSFEYFLLNYTPQGVRHRRLVLGEFEDKPGKDLS
jgi:hypothetical protein